LLALLKTVIRKNLQGLEITAHEELGTTVFREQWEILNAIVSADD